MSKSEDDFDTHPTEEETSVEEIDLSNDPMYCIFSTLLTDESGNNVCDHLEALTAAVRENTKMLSKVLSKLAQSE